MARRILLLLLIIQALTHLFWLSPAVHSGQLAIPWMMNRGLSLFDELWEQHAPGSSLLGAAAQSLFRIDPALLVKLLNTILVIAMTAMVFQLARSLTGRPSGGLFAAAVWAWWEPVYGNIMLYFDTLLAFCVLGALLVYYRRGGGPSSVMLVGLLMGAATLFKQQAWLAVAVFGLWLIYADGRRNALRYALAALALPLIQWLLLAAGGLLDGYIFWNWTFNLRGFMDGVPLDGDLFRKLLLGNMLVFPFALMTLQKDKRSLLPLPLMWLAALTVLYPRFGEIHGMGQLPFAAVMSGMVLAWAAPHMTRPREWDRPRVLLAGLAMGIGVGWLWTGAVSYIPTELGRGAILAYDEFDALTRELRDRGREGDTLFVLPETDSTPQLHARTDMLPPGLWIKGWRWYFRPDFVLPALKDAWAANPPTWVIVFPDMLDAGRPGIYELLDIVERDYQLQFTTAKIFEHGPAQAYRLPT